MQFWPRPCYNSDNAYGHKQQLVLVTVTNTTAAAAAHATCSYSLTMQAHLHKAFQVLLAPVCLGLLPFLELHGVL